MKEQWQMNESLETTIVELTNDLQNIHCDRNNIDMTVIMQHLQEEKNNCMKIKKLPTKYSDQKLRK